MAALRRLMHIRRVLAVDRRLTANKYEVMPVRTMSADVNGFLESTFSCSDMNILSSETKCKELMSYYEGLNGEDKANFLHKLSEKYGVNQENVIRVAQSVATSQEKGKAILLTSEERLRNTLTPRYQHMFRQISRLDRGVKFLVDMRADVINLQQKSLSEVTTAYYRALNSTLRELLSLWFCVGFLQLQRVTWESPCDLVQKISDYEAVHPMRNWNDLKRRLGPYRRCFVFTHKSMPREPVVVLHTALTKEISSSIHSIIQSPGFWPTGVTREGGQSFVNATSSEGGNVSPEVIVEDQSLISTAVFYSITSTQKGLQGVEMGNYLIKKAICDLQQEYKHISQFSSLSPIPGFKEWLLTELNPYIHATSVGESLQKELLTEKEMSSLAPYFQPNQTCIFNLFKDLIQSNKWVTNRDLEPVIKPILMRLCARYLYIEKRRQYALNPVANFHLRNGAVMWRINWMADMSSRGLTASCGMMVNYRYYLPSTELNSSKYLGEFHIEASQEVLNLCSNT